MTNEELEQRLSRLSAEAWDPPTPPALNFDPDEARPGAARRRAGAARKRPRWLPALGLAPVAAAAVLAVVMLGGDDDAVTEPEQVTLSALPSHRGASGDVKLDDRLNVNLRDVDPSGRDRYEVWLIRDGQPRSVGTLRAGDDGTAQASFDLPGDHEKYRTIAVTREPPDGNPLPSSDAVLTASRA